MNFSQTYLENESVENGLTGWPSPSLFPTTVDLNKSQRISWLNIHAAFFFWNSIYGNINIYLICLLFLMSRQIDTVVL